MYIIKIQLIMVNNIVVHVVVHITKSEILFCTINNTLSIPIDKYKEYQIFINP